MVEPTSRAVPRASEIRRSIPTRAVVRRCAPIRPGEDAAHVHPRQAKLYVSRESSTFGSSDRARVGRTPGRSSRRVVHTSSRATARSSSTRRARATAATSGRWPGSTSDPQRTPRPGSSSAVREARRATRSPTGRSAGRPCSSRPTSSRSPSSTTGRASAERSRHVHREHADAFLVARGRVHVPPARRLARASQRARSSSSRQASSTASTTTRAGTRARFNFHMPSFGFADYMRGRNPDFDQFDPPEDGGVDPAAVVVARLSE